MFDDLINAASVKYGVPVPWIQAVIQTESSWNPQAYRAEPQIGDASYGLMQLLYRTAQGLGFAGPADKLFDPAINIDLGTKLLSQLRARWGDDFRAIYSAYNSGSPTKWQTSSEVAANVARAMAALEEWAARAVNALAGSPTIALLVVGVLLWAWGKKSPKEGVKK